MIRAISIFILLILLPLLLITQHGQQDAKEKPRSEPAYTPSNVKLQSPSEDPKLTPEERSAIETASRHNPSLMQAPVPDPKVGLVQQESNDTTIKVHPLMLPPPGSDMTPVKPPHDLPPL